MSVAASSSSTCTTTLPGAWVAPDFCAYTVPVDVSVARGILAVGESNFLTLERGTSSVLLCHDTDDDGLADSRRTVASANSINHGLAIYDGYLYASSDSTVFRWRINGESFLNDVGMEEVVINNINEESDGSQRVGHSTRTLEFDDQGRLYVSVGSVRNIDSDSFRSRIRRFDIQNADPALFPIDFLDGEVFADGLRNEVGLAFDKHGVLWGVENSADNLFRSDMGGEIHQDNPAEELNRFREEDAGKNFGYPQCWTEFDVPEPYGLGQGTIWAWPSFLDEVSDEWCRENTVPPEMALQGHSAPLGLTFYQWKSPLEMPSSCPQRAAFPREMDGYAFIAYHGSWNRDIPTGYKVVYVEMDENGNPVGQSPYDLLKHEPPNAQWEDGFRPVDVSFDECGRLLVSSDGTRGAGSKIVRIDSTTLPVTSAPTEEETTESSSSTLAPTEEESMVSTSNENVTHSPSGDWLGDHNMTVMPTIEDTQTETATIGPSEVEESADDGDPTDASARQGSEAPQSSGRAILAYPWLGALVGIAIAELLLLNL